MARCSSTSPATARAKARLVTFGARETLDVAAALRYLRTRGDVDMTHIGLMGYSLGAITAVLAAAALPEPRCVVIESGFADLERDLGMLFRRYTGLPSFPFAQLVVFWGQLLAKVRLSEIRPMRVIGRISPRAVFMISDLLDELADEPYDGEHLYDQRGRAEGAVAGGGRTPRPRLRAGAGRVGVACRRLPGRVSGGPARDTRDAGDAGRERTPGCGSTGGPDGSPPDIEATSCQSCPKSNMSPANCARSWWAAASCAWKSPGRASIARDATR